jgi:hypothetical protein
MPKYNTVLLWLESFHPEIYAMWLEFSKTKQKQSRKKYTQGQTALLKWARTQSPQIPPPQA